MKIKMPGPRPTSRGGSARRGNPHGHSNHQGKNHSRYRPTGHFPRIYPPPRRHVYGLVPQVCPHCGNLMYPTQYLPGGGMIVRCSFIYCQFTMTLY